MPISEETVLNAIANGSDAANERPYFDRTDDGAMVYLLKPYNAKGDTVLAVRDPIAEDFMKARSASKADEEQLYAHMIAALTGIQKTEVGKLYLRDYVLLRQVVDVLSGF